MEGPAPVKVGRGECEVLTEDSSRGDAENAEVMSWFDAAKIFRGKLS